MHPILARFTGGLKNLPDVWGEGAIFAASGLDGPTSAASQFVATFARDPFSLLFHLPRRRFLNINVPGNTTPLIVTGDVVAIEADGDALVLCYTHWHTITGQMPAGTRLDLWFEDGTPAASEAGIDICEDAKAGDALALVTRGNRFAVSYGRGADEARERALAGAAADLDFWVPRRLAIYQKLPTLAIESRDRLLKKCVSVMKANALAAEGPFKQMWSTPDRVPHKHMWLWDSVFHSLAMNHINPAVSWDYLRSVLDTQRSDGMIPHFTTVAGKSSDITQPPILAWGVWENFRRGHDRTVLEYALPRLEKYLTWDFEHRDVNRNGLLEWFIEDSPTCRSGESGLDNSQRFDEATVMDAVDFSVFAACELYYLSRMAGGLGRASDAAAYFERSRAISQAIHERLWDPAEGFYFDAHLDGRLSKVRAVTGFLPLLLDDLPEDRVDRLVAMLRNPVHFNSAFPAPSIAISDSNWCTDMWRGSTWINTNYFIVLGLRKHNRPSEAAWLAEKTIHFVQKYYEQFGVTFEFYDAKDQLPPTQLARKGPHQEPYDIRRKFDSIRDYHWTAALTACLLLQE